MFRRCDPYGYARFGGWPRRRRGLMGIAAAVIAAIAAERLLFGGRFRRRSGLGTVIALGLAVALGTAALRAWRNRQPYDWY